VLAQEVGSQLGLAVFLQQGMAGWITVQSFFAATAAGPPRRRTERLAPMKEGVTGELTRILTELILTRQELHS
jgi:hypothetical protein